MNFIYRRITWIPCFAFLSVLFSFGGDAQSELAADDKDPFMPNAVVQLRKGGQIEGYVTNLDEERPAHYLVKLENGGLLKLKRSVVRRVDTYSDAELRYFARKRTMPETVEAHWAEIDRLKEEGLKREYRDYHLRKIIKLDPENPDARNKLNYTQYGNRWIKKAQLFVDHGYVMVSEFIAELPADLAQVEREKAIKVAAADFRNQIDRARNKTLRDGTAELKAELQKVSGALDVEPVFELIVREVKDRRPKPDSERVQMMYVEAIGQVESGTAISKLAYIAIVHPSQVIREHAIGQLKNDHYDPARVARAFFPYLQMGDYNTAIRRAGFALGEIGHKSAIQPLINALETVHKVAEAENPGQMSFGRSSIGGGGMSVGGQGPKYVAVKNPPVHAALRRVVKSNVDYSYNKMAWMNWYISQEHITQIDLRRDD